MQQSKTVQAEVQELRAAIAKLTRRTPLSSDPRYLRERLASLKARKEAGEDLRRHDDQASVMSLSMPLSARRAIARILEREKISTSELGRRAFALWAKENGYEAEAKTIDGV